MKFPRSLQDKIDQFVWLRVVVLQVKRANLRNEKLEVAALLRLHVWVDSTALKLGHRRRVIRIKLDQTGDRILIFIFTHGALRY